MNPAVIRRSILVLCLLVVPVVGQAGPKEDAKMISELFLQENDEVLRETIRMAYARVLGRALWTRSVKVRDLEAFGLLLPDHLIEERMEVIRQSLPDTIIEAVSAEQFGEIAEYLASYHLRSVATPDHSGGSEDSDPPSLEEWAQSVTETLEDEAFKQEIEITLPLIVLFLMATMQATRVEADLTAPYLPDIMEADTTVLVYPNRIWRNDLIRELRDANG